MRDLYELSLKGLVLTARLLGQIWRQQRRGDKIALRRMTWGNVQVEDMSTEDKQNSPTEKPDGATDELEFYGFNWTPWSMNS